MNLDEPLRQIINRIAARAKGSYFEPPRPAHQTQRPPICFYQATLRLNVAQVDLVAWLKSLNRPPPDQMYEEQRVALIRFLLTSRGLRTFRAFTGRPSQPTMGGAGVMRRSSDRSSEDLRRSAKIR